MNIKWRTRRKLLIARDILIGTGIGLVGILLMFAVVEVLKRWM